MLVLYFLFCFGIINGIDGIIKDKITRIMWLYMIVVTFSKGDF